ncbi:MAG: macrolide ABC transporter ATP-binding protein, partial [Blautia sp.]|nr:macrolide ABC transporter ATP-binding protein [Blautia sp.]
MRTSELLRLVGQNINQNKFKSIMTSIGIVVGAATIVLVIGIGRGGQMDVAEQFAQLNAGAINISYEYEGEEEKKGGGFSFGGMGGFGAMFGAGGMPQFGSRSSSGDSATSGGGFPGNGTMPDGFPGSGST